MLSHCFPYSSFRLTSTLSFTTYTSILITQQNTIAQFDTQYLCGTYSKDYLLGLQLIDRITANMINNDHRNQRVILKYVAENQPIVPQHE